jgi:hypothetical protein
VEKAEKVYIKKGPETALPLSPFIPNATLSLNEFNRGFLCPVYAF